MKNEVSQCKVNPSGVHEYVTSTTLGEECKHCGLLRSTIESASTEQPLNLERDEYGNILSPFSADFRKEGIERTAAEMAEKVMEGAKKGVSDETYQTILKETKSQAAIIIAFPNHITNGQFMLHDFHISAVNVDYRAFPAVLAIVIDALLGRLGGIMNFRKPKDGDDPQPTGV